MPGNGQPRRAPGSGVPPPAQPAFLASQPDPDRVIEPEAPQPKPPAGGPVTGPGTPPPGPADQGAAGAEPSRPEPPARETTRPGVPRPEPPDRPAGPRPEPPARRAAHAVPGSEPADEPVTGPIVPRPDAQIERQVAQPLAPLGSEVAPSWGNVVGTTVRLWAERRGTGWRVLAALVVALIVFAAGGLTVALLRKPGPGTAAGSGSAASGASGLGPVQAAATARQQAAKWVVAQVSQTAVVSCDSAMCAALQARGFPAGDLMTLGPAANDPLGSAVIVATAAIRSEFGGRLTSVYAPTVIASFGSGSARIDVRVYAAGGAAMYLAALRADELSRQSVGSQLLRNSRVSATMLARQQLAAGQVDSRLLITIATLSGQGPVSLVAFSDSGPGASPGAPLRQAELTSPPGAKSGYLQSVIALLRAQQEPYLANSVTLARLANGQEVVRIEFAAPSPLGLLSG